MTVQDAIVDYLSENGRSTVGELANGTGYATGYVRQNAKELRNEGTIHGEKVPRRIPAAIINGELEVLSSSRDQLLAIVRAHAPSLESEAKSLSNEEIRNLIAEEIAEDTLAFEQGVWEFW